MRRLWRESQGGPIDEAAIAGALEAVGGRSYTGELSRWANGTDELPLRELLEAHGVAVHEDPAQLAQALGLRVDESSGTVRVKAVLRGGQAEQSGMAPGDEWLAVETQIDANSYRGGWRITSLNDLGLYIRSGSSYLALIARNRQLCRINLGAIQNCTTLRLTVSSTKNLKPWIA